MHLFSCIYIINYKFKDNQVAVKDINMIKFEAWTDYHIKDQFY